MRARGAVSHVGENPHPVALHRPASGPLSAVAQLGRRVFFDSTLSATGRISCASCHSPDNAYAPPPGGGSMGNVVGVRAVPSLRYSDRTPNFSIGPEESEQEFVDLNGVAASARSGRRTDAIPHGGLFWDGRVNTLQDQAMGPLLGHAEMGNNSIGAAAARLRTTTYVDQFIQLFGPGVAVSPSRLVDEAMFAVARFQIEDPSFHPYTSKYDYYLEGRVTLSGAEARGRAAFEDTARGNCASCHRSQPSSEGSPPLFTDYEYEALGAPRNTALVSNRDPRYFDLGLCGPIRTDLHTQTQYCGMFRTPSLRNVATRAVFFHNGVFHALEEVLAFYNLRDVRPAAVYPSTGNGGAAAFNDLPLPYRANVDLIDRPFGRPAGTGSILTDAERRDIIAFLRTLTDDYPVGAPVSPH